MMFLALKRTSGDHSLDHASIFITALDASSHRITTSSCQHFRKSESFYNNKSLEEKIRDKSHKDNIISIRINCSIYICILVTYNIIEDLSTKSISITHRLKLITSIMTNHTTEWPKLVLFIYYRLSCLINTE